MSKPLGLPERRVSAFLPAAERSDVHIVDTLIEERCPSLRASPAWPLLKAALYPVLGYRRARRMADELMDLPGAEAFDRLAGRLSVSLDISHLDRVPQAGRVIVAANHPTGLADGVAVWDLLKQRRSDTVFLANADALRVNPDFEDVMIPVEWVAEKRTPAKTRETLRRAGEAFEAEKCVVIFPSGRLARKVGRELEEKDWFPTVIGLARRQDAPIVPLNIDARNSRLYYLLCNISNELRDITLFHELLNKRGAPFRMTFGHPIEPDALQGDQTELTERLKQHVSRALRSDPDAAF